MSSPSKEKKTSPPNAFLIVESQVYPIKKSVVTLGRRLTNHLAVDDPRVSRSHAQIRVINNRYYIVDLKSTGGTYVNGNRVDQAILYSGDEISLAGFNITFVEESEDILIDSEEYTAPTSSKPSQDRITAERESKA